MKASTATRYLAVLIIIIALLCGVTIASGIYTNGYQSVKTRYVLANGAVIKKNKAVNIPADELKIELTGAGFKTVDWGEYTVTVSAAQNVDIAYECDGESFLFSELGDITQAFNIEKQANAFTIAGGEACTIEAVLKTLHGGKAVKIVKSDYDLGSKQYLVTIETTNGKKTEFYLNAYIIDPEKIEVNPPEIITGKR